MFVRLAQATTITLTLYALLGLNTLQIQTAASAVEPAEVIVALKEVFTRR